MNSNHCSKLLALLFAAMIVVGSTGLAGAVSVASEDVPEEAAVDEEVTAQVELDDLYDEYDSWTLEGETELENVTWTVEYYDGDTQIGSEEVDGQEISQDGIDRNLDEEPREIVVTVTGDVPDVESFSYDDPEEFVVMDLAQTRGDDGTQNEIDTWSAHHYTQDSKEARQSIEDAEAAIETAESGGADVSNAEDALDDAIGFYENGDFDRAVQNAEDASEEAESSQSSAQTRSMLLYGGAGLVALLVLGGVGYLLYQRQGDDYDKLG